MTNGGTITGTVHYNGQMPAAPGIIVGKDQDACGATHANAADPGKGSGIAGALVYLDTITSGKPFEKMNGKTLLDQHGCEFLPHVMILRNGGSIIVRNSDKALHNFRVTLSGRPITNSVQPEGAPEQEVTFTQLGLNVVQCDVHPWMRGFVMVVDHPYYAITDTAGRFTLSNVPPGTYTLKLWRDNWQIEQPKASNGSGAVMAYDWGGDFHGQQQVTVSGGTTTANFMVP